MKVFLRKHLLAFIFIGAGLAFGQKSYAQAYSIDGDPSLASGDGNYASLSGPVCNGVLPHIDVTIPAVKLYPGFTHTIFFDIINVEGTKEYGEVLATAGGVYHFGAFSPGTYIARTIERIYDPNDPVPNDPLPAGQLQAYYYYTITVSALTPTVKTTKAGFCTPDGSIQFATTFGTAPLQFKLTNEKTNKQLSQPDSLFTLLRPGRYTADITDANGCAMQVTDIAVSKQQPKVAVTAVSNCGAGDNDGTIIIKDIAAAGSPYTINYLVHHPDGSTSIPGAQSITGLTQGTYLVDAGYGACDTTFTVVVPQAAPLTVSIAGMTAQTNCSGVPNGGIRLKQAGGIRPYTYFISQNGNVTTSSSNVFNGVAGTFTQVGVTDAKGCVGALDNVTVGEKFKIPVIRLVSVTQTICNDAGDGIIFVNARNAGKEYTFKLYLGPTLFQTNNSGVLVYGFGGYTYQAAVTNNATGCTSSINVPVPANNANCSGIVAAQPGVSAAQLAKAPAALAVRVLPNPSKTVFTLVVTGGSTAPVEIQVTDMMGRAVHQARGAANTTYTFGQSFAQGMYIARVMQGGAVVSVKMVKE